MIKRTKFYTNLFRFDISIVRCLRGYFFWTQCRCRKICQCFVFRPTCWRRLPVEIVCVCSHSRAHIQTSRRQTHRLRMQWMPLTEFRQYQEYVLLSTIFLFYPLLSVDCKYTFIRQPNKAFVLVTYFAKALSKFEPSRLIDFVNFCFCTF